MNTPIESIIDVKNRNIKSILQELRTCESMTKRKLSESLGLSFATVSNMCNLLEKHGYIRGDMETNHGLVGRAPKSISLIPDAKYIAVADLHQSGYVTMELYDIAGVSQAKDGFQYTTNDIGKFMELFKRKYESGFSEEMRKKVVGMGVAVSGIYDTETECVVASELEIFENQPLKKKMSHLLSIPVYIENESTLCAFGKAQSENIENLIYIYIGEGLGVGIVSDGRKLVGQRGYSSEICHAPLGRMDKLCPLCGNEKCMQTDLSIYGFAEKFTGYVQKKGDHSDWEKFLEAFNTRDKMAIKVAKENAEILAAGISILVNLLDPASIVISGVPSDLYEVLSEVARKDTKARRVVQNAPEPQFSLDSNFSKTVMDGTAEMAYVKWQPDL